MEMIIAHGPIIIQEDKVLVTMDKKDPFYKIPGGRPLEGETGEETCKRRTLEETGLEIIILGKANTMFLDKDPKTEEPKQIELHHYFAKTVSPIKSFEPYEHNGQQVRWISIEEIKMGVYLLAPNIKFLIEKGDIK
jgi:ADP-ribose pyrophosphatase YjhB (NUDIX family)